MNAYTRETSAGVGYECRRADEPWARDWSRGRTFKRAANVAFWACLEGAFLMEPCEVKAVTSSDEKDRGGGGQGG